MTEEACIEALREAPGDAERWAVYADLLEGRGDVRGQLASLALRGSARVERQLRDRHRKHLASPAFWALLDAGALEPTWAFGHLRAATLHFTPPDVAGGATTGERPSFDPGDVDAVLASPLACALDALTLRLPADAALATRALDVLRTRRPSLRWLEVTANLTADALRAEGLLDALPRLRVARLVGLSALPHVTSGALESLTAWLSDWDGAPPARLGTLAAPGLRALRLRVRADTQPALTRWLREGLRAPGLRHLGVEARATSQLLEAVADAPYAPSLERLSVVTVDEASARVLLSRRDAFPRLSRLEARFYRTARAIEEQVRAAYGATCVTSRAEPPRRE
ncbi:MAG: hypothetical protein INH41_27415 [Myxococcaceae bacterium]|jgi:hypothetical protein|nr:hypothetical protein [Myxococcaceae bacterium]MCA3016129.1 hypothetical protein [Myxococcaceae bacterium]